MDTPNVYAKEPIMIDLEAGKEYHFCTCGKSETQPFCNGSHKGTGFTPMPFSVDKDQKAALCQCKNSANLPFCDGTHVSM